MQRDRGQDGGASDFELDGDEIGKLLQSKHVNPGLILDVFSDIETFAEWMTTPQHSRSVSPANKDR